MGYLNSDTITVDAILTKHGRYELAKGNGLNIKSYALSDDTIDYRLWNVNHPSGSDSYGEAIKRLPNLEACPMDRTMMKYKLVTLNRSTKYMPYLRLNLDKNVVISGQGRDYEIETMITTLNGHDSGYEYVINDETFLGVTGATLSSMDSGYGQPNATTLEIPRTTLRKAGADGRMKVKALPVSKTKKTTVTVTGKDTGATTTFTITALGSNIRTISRA